MLNKLKHASFFTGIGGFDMAAEFMGYENIFQCEIDPFCQDVLAYHFPNCKLYEDITKTDFSKYKGKIDFLTGGFPCQPFSASGSQLGTKDRRFLWPAMFRGIKQIKPTYVVAENVLGLTFKGGVVLERVARDLESEGFEVQTIVFPACAVGAIRERQRVWIVGYNAQNRSKEYIQAAKSEKRIVTDSHKVAVDNKLIKARINSNQVGQGRTNLYTHGTASIGVPWPTKSPVCGRNDGIPSGLDGITLSKWKEENFKAFGNAIAPQAAIKIFQHLPLM